MPTPHAAFLGKRCRSSFSETTTGHRRICSMARGWWSGSSRRRRNWDLPPLRKAVFGKITPINRNRGRLIDLNDGARALVTVHPSYLLRLSMPMPRHGNYRRFVEDLMIAADLLRRSARAA